MATSLERIASRLRSHVYGDDADSLAKDLATALVSQGKLASFPRGLFAGVIASENGGTTLDVGDPSAGRLSKSLQAPQRGMPSPNGALGVRMQANIEQQVKMLPARVLFSEKPDTTHLRVDFVLAADQPYIVKDSSSNQNSAKGNPYDVLQSGAGTKISITELVDSSVTAFAVGSIITVSKTTQWDVRTIWTNKEGRRIPVVRRGPETNHYSLTNVAAGTPAPPLSCVTAQVFSWVFMHRYPPPFPISPPPLGVNTVNLSGFTGDGQSAALGGYWRIIEFQPDLYDANGANDHYPWAAAGKVNAAGRLVGLPSTYTDWASVGWYHTFSTPPAPPETQYQKEMVIETGCPGDDNLIHWFPAYPHYYSNTSPISDFPP